MNDAFDRNSTARERALSDALLTTFCARYELLKPESGNVRYWYNAVSRALHPWRSEIAARDCRPHTPAPPRNYLFWGIE